MDFLNKLNFPIPKDTAETYLHVSLTLLAAVILDNLLRSFIQIPKAFDNKRALTYVTIFRNLITFLVYVIAINIILIELKINITPILASAGILGVILGIGARSIIEDLITGLFLLSQQAITIGDYVKIDTDEGSVSSIGMRTLTLKDSNGALIIIPNGLVKKVTNYSRYRAMVNINLPVKVNQDIEKVLKAAKDALSQLEKDKEIENILYSGSKVVGVTNFEPNSTQTMMITVTIITSSTKRWEVGNTYRYLIKKEFEKQNLLFA